MDWLFATEATSAALPNTPACSWCWQKAVLYTLASLSALWISAYVLPLMYCWIRGPQNLKRKYDASWALVTGGSTGIGKSLAVELASQGINVVIAALPDEWLGKTQAELQEQFPELEFRAVAVSFAPGADYLEKIVAATNDIDVQLVFNNAGFIVTGFFDSQPCGKHLVNVECNSTAVVPITHHFAALMLQKGLRGCIVFTSSASAYIPNPFAVTYGATKAFVSQFAASIAVELQCKGIDVCCVHPSPVASNFFNKVEHKIDSMESFKKVAVTPDTLPKKIFSAIGRMVLYDTGATAIGMRLGVALLPYNALAAIIALCAPILPDYTANDSNRGGGVAAASSKKRK